MSCRFDKTSFLKNGADEVGQECADQDQNKQKGCITLIYPFFTLCINMQSVDDAADRIEKATGQKPEETDLSQGQIDRLDP